MDRQAKETLHLMAGKLMKKIEQCESQNQDFLAENKKMTMSEKFTLFACDDTLGDEYYDENPSILYKAKLKLVYFELNRLYMRSKEYKCGYNVLKKLIKIMPTDVEVLPRIAKY